jgi:hypothetical protein
MRGRIADEYGVSRGLLHAPVAPAASSSAAYGTRWVRPELEAEVDSKGLVEFVDKRWWQSADSLAYPLDSYRTNLFRLRF